MAFDPTSLMLAGLAYLLWKGGGKSVKSSQAPWPADSEFGKGSGTGTRHYDEGPMQKGIPGVSRFAHEAVTTSEVPVMQKGIPGVSRFAHAAVEQMKREQEAREFGSGSGTGTRHRDWRPARHVTPEEVLKARQLLLGWHPGARWRDDTDPSTMYVAKKHGNKRAVEVWKAV